MMKFTKAISDIKDQLLENRLKLSMAFFPLTIIYLELVVKLSVYKMLLNIGFLYMVFFSIPAGLLMYILSTSFKASVNRRISILLTLFLTLLYLVQEIYYKVFSTFLVLYSLNGTGQVLQFWQEIAAAMKKSAPMVLLLLLPLLLLLLYGKKFMPEDKTKLKLRRNMAVTAIIVQVAVTFIAVSADKGEMSTKFLYSESVIPVLSVERFGLLTATRLDLKHLIFGLDASLEEEPDGVEAEKTKAPSTPGNQNTNNNPGTANSTNKPDNEKPKEIEYNVMEIDFDRLIAEETEKDIAAMHKYFNSLKPTQKNDYTGLFKGKNLILITAEGFSPYVIDKELTPTLYRMYSEGFQFTNFYTPLWGVSTSDGEYVACNSLVPKSGVWSFYVSGRNYMPFVLGNQLKQLGYGTRAYHNHTYTYYHREVSHPNMGYIYKGVGNGLELKNTWPESDLEMIEKTVGEYIGSTPFHTYYMTVSGHLQYSFIGNSMANKNRELVSHLPYSDAVKAYLACNLEFEKAMEKLIEELEKAGIAEDTVIAISPDHYPYGLTNDELSELAGHPIETDFELYRGVFLLWSKGMKPQKVDKLCCSMDILPTLSNLMGITYDSRLLMGRDIFSDAPPLVVFSDWSWMTDKAKYSSKKKKLTIAEGCSEEQVNQEYRSTIARQVKNMFTYSTKIIEVNYYEKIWH